MSVRLFGAVFVLCVLLCRTTDAVITGASVTPASLDAGVTGSVDVVFTSGTTIPVGGVIIITFPSNFYISPVSITNHVGLDTSCSLTVTPAGYQTIITIATTAVAPGTVSFTMDSIDNPGECTTATYTITTQDASGVTLESISGISRSVISKTSLSSATLAPSTTTPAGARVSYTLSFTTDVKLRIGSIIELGFPTLPYSKFVYTDATITSRVNIDAASTSISVFPPYLRLTVAGQDIPAGTALSLTYSNIINPAAQSTGLFIIRTRHSSGAIYQENVNVAGPTTQMTTLSSVATVTPASYYAGAITLYTISFANAAYLPTGTQIIVTFPSRFIFGSVSLVSLTGLGSINTFLTVPSSTTLKLTLGQGPILAGSGRSFTVKNIVNPGSSCDEFIIQYCLTTWETYTISIVDSGANGFEESTTVPGTPIVKKSLVFGRVRPLVKQQYISTSAVVTLTTETTIPIGGSISVEFPEGYQINSPTPTASLLVGISLSSTVVTVADLELSLIIAGAAILPTSGLSVTFSGVTTPSALAIGEYIIRTRDAYGAIMEESKGIRGEGCPHLSDCNGHGTCTLFSKVCICDSGWGAPTDTTTYRSPDCSTRVCPSDFSWNAIPTSATTAHNQLEECAGIGICDRSSGKCICPTGFLGTACQRMGCPNNCSGRGQCVSMREMATSKNALPLSAPSSYTGAITSTTWDEVRIFGCICDSSWAVGTSAGEIQVTEYFGADCSRRHCPTGDDPETVVNETDCNGKAAPGGFSIGLAGNICHVECSNRGICDYKTGICRCFSDYTGYACQTRTVVSV